MDASRHTHSDSKEKGMSVDPRAGKPPDPSTLANIPRLMTAYYTRRPDPSVREQRVAFGTSGHRGSAFDGAFNERHILAITQAICVYRRQERIYKLYAESFKGRDHLTRIQAEAQAVIQKAYQAGAAG